MTLQDINVPEYWEFLPNQVTPLSSDTPGGETLHAWHILPVGIYRNNEDRQLHEDFTSRRSSRF